MLVHVGFPKKAGMQQGEQLQKWELPRVLNLEKESRLLSTSNEPN